EAGADLVEELEGDVLAVQDRQRAAELVQVEAVAGGADQLLDVGLKLLRLGQGRGDLAMLQKRGGQVAQEHAAVGRGTLELAAGFSVTHGEFRSINSAARGTAFSSSRGLGFLN